MELTLAYDATTEGGPRAIVQLFDALTSDPMRDAAFRHIRKEWGNHFDPRVINVFIYL